MKNGILFIVALILSFSMVQISFAQSKGGSGGGSSNSADTGDQLQDREQDRIQDPATHTGDEPDQDRDQDQLQDQDQDRDRDQIQDPTTHDGDEPLQNREKDNRLDLEDNPIMPNENPGLQAQSAEQLRNMMLIRHQELLDESEEFDMPAREILQNQNQFRETAYAFLAAGPLVSGIHGEQVRMLAQQMQEHMQEMVQAEYALQNQSRLSHMLFGGDDENGGVILERCERVREQIREMNQYIDECPGCSEQLRETLREQLRLTEQECERLEGLGRDEVGSRGVFGFLFGWLR